MTRDDVIRIAREAGATFDHMTWVERDLQPVFERFAALVAAAEREAGWNAALEEAAEYAASEGNDLLADSIRELRK